MQMVTPFFMPVLTTSKSAYLSNYGALIYFPIVGPAVLARNNVSTLPDTVSETLVLGNVAVVQVVHLALGVLEDPVLKLRWYAVEIRK